MKPTHHATLYTRQGCHLCDIARETLERHSIVVTAIDIDLDPELREKYNECVPVIWIDGRERYRGLVDERLLKRLLEAGPR
jgi:glutaredoxin